MKKNNIFIIIPIIVAVFFMEITVGNVKADDILTQQDVVQTGQKVKLGDYIFLGKYYDQPVLWRCVAEDENGLLMLSDKVLCFKAYDACGESETYHNDGWGYIRKQYGSNCWEDSSIRQWLNSSLETVIYSHCPPTTENVGNGCNPYDTEPGFLNGFSDSEQSCIKQVTQVVNVNEWEPNREGYCDGGNEEIECKSFYDYPLDTDYTKYFYKKCTDKVFLLNAGQVNFIRKNFGEYINAYPTEMAVNNNGDKSLDVNVSDICAFRINVPGTLGASYEHVETIPENLNPGGAYMSCGIRPAFYLDENAYSGEVYSSKPNETIKKYSITVKNGSAAQTSAMENEYVSIVASVSEGYEFEKWTSNVGDSIFENPNMSATRIHMPAMDVVIDAVLKTVVPTTAPTDNPTSVLVTQAPTSTKQQDATATPAPVKIKINKAVCKKGKKAITGTVSVKGATVKIKVGSKAYKKATVKGKSFTLKLSYKLKKKTKVTIKVTKKDCIGIRKAYKVI